MTHAIDTQGGFIRATGTEARVCELIARRQQFGLGKYGTSVEANPLTLRQWLVHQQEELADALVYATRAIEQLDKQADDGK
jgi:hypothetical protein